MFCQAAICSGPVGMPPPYDGPGKLLTTPAGDCRPCDKGKIVGPARPQKRKKAGGRPLASFLRCSNQSDHSVRLQEAGAAAFFFAAFFFAGAFLAFFATFFAAFLAAFFLATASPPSKRLQVTVTVVGTPGSARRQNSHSPNPFDLSTLTSRVSIIWVCRVHLESRQQFVRR